MKGSDGHHHGAGERPEGLPAIEKLNLTELVPDGAMPQRKWVIF